MRTKLALPVSLLLAGCHSDSDSAPAPAPQPVAFNLGLAVSGQVGTGAVRLVLASEEDQGRDLTGDGDLEDSVWHILRQLPGAPVADLVNTGLAGTGPSGPFPGPSSDSNDALALFLVSEAATGVDLDHDGDPFEVATWTFNARTGRLQGLPFAHVQHALGGDLAAFLVQNELGNGFELFVFDGRDGSLTQLPVEPSGLLATGDGLVAFGRAENGAFDLNADGDADDPLVLHVYDSDSGRVWNASLAVHSPVAIRGGFVGLTVSEELNGSIDLDGNGSTEDVVFVAVDGRSGLLRIPGFHHAELAEFESHPPERFLLMAFEGREDLDGDGNLGDAIALVYDPARDEILSSGMTASYPFLHLAGRWLGLVAFDPAGSFENVPFVHDTLTGRTTSLGFTGLFLAALEEQLLGVELRFGVPWDFFAWDPRAGTTRFPDLRVRHVVPMSAGEALLLVGEDGLDLNGDGDVVDVVLHHYDAPTRRVTNLRLATTSAVRGSDGRAAVLVSEEDQGGLDLNGDGDAEDLVLHEVLLDPPQG